MNTNRSTVTVLLVLTALYALPQGTNQALATDGQHKAGSQTQRQHEVNLPNGVIGVSLHIGAERIGEPALLHVAFVHPEGPAQQAGLKHGNEVVAVNSTPVTGKTYEEVIKMVRGKADTAVTLGVKDEGGLRELTITRVASDTLYKDDKWSHGGSAR